jgi:hypothetical protein
LAVVAVVLLLAILAVLLIRQNKAEHFRHKSETGRKAMGRGIAIGYAIGIGPGIAIGVALDNIGMGIAIGAGMGISIGVAIGAGLKKKAEQESGITSVEHETPQQGKLLKILAIIVALAGVLVLGWLFLQNR